MMTSLKFFGVGVTVVVMLFCAVVESAVLDPAAKPSNNPNNNFQVVQAQEQSQIPVDPEQDDLALALADLNDGSEEDKETVPSEIGSQTVSNVNSPASSLGSDSPVREKRFLFRRRHHHHHHGYGGYGGYGYGYRRHHHHHHHHGYGGYGFYG